MSEHDGGNKQTGLWEEEEQHWKEESFNVTSSNETETLLERQQSRDECVFDWRKINLLFFLIKRLNTGEYSWLY